MENCEGCVEPLQVIETGWGSENESALLRDLLARNKKSVRGRNSRARLTAYKHRLHALRCDYANARLRVLELEEQWAQAQLQIQQMQATRVWRMRERYHGWRQTISGWLRRLRSWGVRRADEECDSCPAP